MLLRAQVLIQEQFPTTIWTLLGRAAGVDEAGRAALAQLVERYLPAVRAYLRRVHRLRPDEVDELLQGFMVERILERDLVASADPARGRFRCFLTKSLDHYVISSIRKRDALKRGQSSIVPIDSQYSDSNQFPSSDDRMDIEWARTTLEVATVRMHAHCTKINRQDVWRVFESRILLGAFGGAPVSYSALSTQESLQSPTAAANLVITGKRMFIRILREVIGEYEPNAASIDEEIEDLRSILQKNSDFL